MASPFKFFRKNQTQLLVVIGLLTMVSFIILPSVLQMMQVSGNVQMSNNVLVTKKYGNLTSNDMLRLKNQQRVMADFFQRLQSVYQGKLQQIMMGQGGTEVDFQKSMQGYMMAQQNFSMVANQSDKAVVANWLMEHKATEMGITVSDAMVKDFVTKATDGLNTTEYNLIVFGEAEPTSYKSEGFLVEAVRSFMVRSALLSIYGAPWEFNTTGERFDAFCRLNQKASVELYPVVVADLLKDVTKPTDAEIKTFFETYKDEDPTPLNNNCGIRQPQKIVVEYCVAPLANFLKPDAVTDEQIQKYYDENKDTRYVVVKENPEIGLKPEQTAESQTKEYRPLNDELKNEIRHDLAYQNAQEQMKLAIDKVKVVMEKYSTDKDTFEMNFTEEERVKAENADKAPKDIDFDTLSKENGLIYGNTGLVSQETFQTTPLMSEQPDVQWSGIRLADTDTTVLADRELFGKTPVFRAGIYNSQEGNLVIAWKVEDSPAHTPTLDENGIKEQIVEQLKFRSARDMAQAKADQLVKKAVEEKLPLKVCLGDVAFVPPMFSWMIYSAVTNPNMERPMYLSPIEGVKDAGFDFMGAIFQMKNGEIKTIANSSQSTYYVARMIELTPPNNQLFARFIVTPENEYAQTRTGDGQLFFGEFYRTLEKEAGLEWIVRPDEETN